MATITGSWQEAGLFQRLMIVAQGLLILLAYFATVSGFADLMNIHFTGSMTGERVVQLLFVFAVATAVVMAMLIGLHTMLDRERRFGGRATGAIAYFFFLFWSIAFGYGFFWKTFAAEDFTRGQFTRDTAVIQSEVRGIVDTLRNVEDQANRAADLAAKRSLEESAPGGGGTCTNGDNPNSIGAGGPLTDARKKFADDARAQAEEIENRWISPLQAEAGEISWRLRALDPSLNAGLMAADPPREGQPAKKDEKELNRIRASVAEGSKGRKNEYDQVATRANNFVIEAIRLKSSLGQDAKAKFEALAKDMSESQGRPDPRWCEDQELAAAMREAAAEISNLPEPQPISLNFLEGSAAARYATINLARNAISGVTGRLGIKLPETVGTQKANPLGENDIIALYATAAIDFALLIVTILSRPPDSSGSGLSRVFRRRVLRQTEAEPAEIMEDSKRAEQTGAALERKNSVDLNLRRKMREHKAAVLKEDRAELDIDNEQLGIDTKRREIEARRAEQSSARAFGVQVSADANALLADVVHLFRGNRVLASEFLSRTSETITEIDGEFYLALTRSMDPLEAGGMKRFENFLQFQDQYEIKRVDSSDPAYATMRQRLRTGSEEYGQSYELAALFRIERRFGKTLLAVPAPNQIEEEPEEETREFRTPPPQPNNGPTFGEINPEDTIFSRGTARQSSKSTDTNGRDDDHPSTFGQNGRKFTRNDPAEDEGSESDVYEASTNERDPYNADRGSAADKKANVWDRIGKLLAGNPDKTSSGSKRKGKGRREENKEV